MGAKSFLIVAGCVFGIVAAAQFVRIVLRWRVRIGSLDIPLAVSWVAAVVAAGLAIWALRLATF